MSFSSSWQAPASPPENLTAFERAARQIAEEERRLRVIAEGQMREYLRLVVEFAGLFLAEELDRRIRADPHFVSRATPETWRSLLQGVRQGAADHWPQQGQPGKGNGYGWAVEPPRDVESERWHREAERLGAEVARLEDENRFLRSLIQAAPAPQADLVTDRVQATNGSAASGTGSARLASGAAKPRPPANGAASSAPQQLAQVEPLGCDDVRLPTLPAVAPGRFVDLLQTWPRQALALAALGVTGWSMRLAIADLMSANLTTVKADAGSLRRVFQTLARRQFWIEEKVTVAGVHKPDLAEADDTTLILVRLAPLGHEVLRACGIVPVPSEWDVLLAAHGGARQIAHTGLVCAFTYHARLRGWATAVCPPASGPSQPDVLLRRDGVDLFVEVEGESGDAERRMVKWRRQVERQGRVALVAVNADMRLRLVAEAQAAGAERGQATDLQTLFDGQKERGPLWAVEW
jgi:hypothetical protein